MLALLSMRDPQSILRIQLSLTHSQQEEQLLFEIRRIE
jgi:hypothetical protein